MGTVGVGYLTVLLFFTTGSSGQTTTDVKNLFENLFTTQSYNSKIRPADDQTDATDVTIDFFLTGITQFDEKGESLTTSGYLSIQWTDPDLEWTPSSYNNIGSLFVPQDDIWKPDISLRNTFKSLTGLGSAYLNVMVDHSGIVTWTPFQVLTSTCGVDITYFPFDVQTCSMKFIAWSYRKSEVNLVLGSEGIILDEYETNSAWGLIDTDAKGLVESDESAVVFIMKLKRKPLFYLLNIVVPILMLSVLNVFTFVLPVDSGERGSYSITVFLSLAVFLTIVSSTLPQNSDTTSLLGIYLMLMTIISTLIVVITLIELRLLSRDTNKHPIGSYLRMMHSISCKLRCSQRRTSVKVEPINKAAEEGKHDEQPPTPQQEDLEWKTVLASFDYLAFWMFFFITEACTVAIFCIAVDGPS